MSKRKLVILGITLCLSSLVYSNPPQNTLDSLLIIFDNRLNEEHSYQYFELLQSIINEFEKKEDYQSMLQYCELLPAENVSTPSSKIIYDLKLKKAYALYHISQYQTAIEELSNTLKLEADFITGLDSAHIYRQLGDIYYYLGNFETAYSFQIKALKIYEVIGKPHLIARFYYSEGLIFKQQNKLTEALNSYIQAITLTRESGDTSTISDLFSVIGDVYFEMDSLDLALQYQTKAFQIDSLKNYQYGLGYDYFSLGKTYAQLGNFSLALKYHQKSYEIRGKLGDVEELASSLAEIGRLNAKMGDYKTAKTQLLRALEQAKQLGSKPQIQQIFKYLALSAESAKNYKEAYKYQGQYYFLKDSIVNTQSLKAMDELKSQYQFEKQKQQIALLKKEQELNSLYWQLSFGGMLLVIGVLIFGKKLYNKQLKYNQALEEKNVEIKAKNQKLERANEDLEQFAYISSHDLKAPLRTIGSFANLFQRRYKNSIDEQGQEFLGFILKGVKHMNILLEDIYNYTHIDKAPEINEEIDLNETVSKIMFQLNSFLKKEKATVKIAPLPKVRGNANILGQVFQNLIQNGIKFTKPDTKPLVVIDFKLINNKAQICIKDNGIGIDEEFQTKIFTLFKRLHTTEEYSGTGLGLAICKKIIERHDGEIWVESDGQTGSAFYFTLPLANYHPNDIPNKNVEKSEISKSNPPQKITELELS